MNRHLGVQVLALVNQKGRPVDLSPAFMRIWCQQDAPTLEVIEFCNWHGFTIEPNPTGFTVAKSIEIPPPVEAPGQASLFW